MIILHRGKSGDLISLCAWLKYKGLPTRIYVKEHRSYTRLQMEFIKPLMMLQDNVLKLDICENISEVENIPDLYECNLNKAREYAEKYNFYTGWFVDDRLWWQQVNADRNHTDLRYRLPLAFNEPMPEQMDPWLKVPESLREIKEPYIVVTWTPRYKSCLNFSALNMLKNKYRIIFIGKKSDYDMLTPSICLYYPVQSSIHAAQIIRDSSLFVGTQTCFTWIAEALGVDRIVSLSRCFFDTTLRVNKGFKGAFYYPALLGIQLVRWLRSKGRLNKIGYVICTYGSPAYIDIQLALHKKWGHTVIVSDDGSKNQKLKLVCAKWDVPLIGVDDERLGHQKGDLLGYKRAIKYFSDPQHSCSTIVKISRRFVWNQDYSQYLDQYQWKPVVSAWWIPYASYGKRAITTCCIALNLLCMPEEIINAINNIQVADKGTYMLVALYRALAQFYGEVPFLTWKLMYIELGRLCVAPGILWKNNSKPLDYKKLSDSLGLDWTLLDFVDITTL